MTKRSTKPGRPRTSLDVTGTFLKSQASLCFRSDLATKYATLWLTASGSLKVPASGIIRRALAVYMQHLASADAAEEVRAVRNACGARPVDDQSQQMALLRLYAGPPGDRPPPFRDIVTSPTTARQMAELTDRAEAMAAECLKHRRGGRRAAV